MEKIEGLVQFRREQLRLLSKKALLKMLGYNNLKSYAKDRGETGKVSRKQLASVVLRNGVLDE